MNNELPIPEKKYTSVKNTLQKLLQNQKKKKKIHIPGEKYVIMGSLNQTRRTDYE